MEMVRLLEYRHALSTQLIPRFAEHIYSGFGAPVFVFYAPLFLFFSSIVSFIVSTEIAVKTVIVFFAILGALGAFKWLATFFSKNVAFAGSVVFAFTAYRAVDIFARNAFSEYTAFMLLPCVLWGITYILQKGKVSYLTWGFITGIFTAFLLSHNITILISIPFLLLYTACVWWKTRMESGGNVLKLFGAGMVAFLLSSFFLLPAFLEKNLVNTSELLQGKFVYSQNYAVLETMFTDMSAMYYVPLLLIIFAVLPVFFLHRKTSWRPIYVLGLIWTIVALCMMLPVSDVIWQALPILHFVQFPWRFMVLLSIGILPMIAAFFTLFENKKYWYLVATAVICAATLPHFALYMKEDSRFTFYPEDLTLERVYNERLRLTVGDEYLPAMTRDTSYTFDRRFVDHTSSMLFPKVYEETVDNAVDSNIELPLFKFPYFEVLVDGRQIPVEQTLSPFLTVKLPAGTHRLEVVLVFTAVHWVGVVVSFVTLLGVLVGGVIVIARKHLRK